MLVSELVVPVHDGTPGLEMGLPSAQVHKNGDQRHVRLPHAHPPLPIGMKGLWASLGARLPKYGLWATEPPDSGKKFAAGSSG
jgi:hypothetical protein